MAATEIVDLLALCRVRNISWNLVAREAQRPGGLGSLLAGRPTERGPDADEAVALLAAAESELEAHRVAAAAVVDELEAAGIGLTTVLDDDYPANLRLIHNLPPFLTYRGVLRPDDARSVAVVGTREASEEGKERAARLATQLAEAGVTVLSGLARGIDTSAHEATLAAGVGRSRSWGPGSSASIPPRTPASPNGSWKVARSCRSSGPTRLRRRTRFPVGTL